METAFSIIGIIILILIALALIFWVPVILLTALQWILVDLPCKIVDAVKDGFSAIFRRK